MKNLIFISLLICNISISHAQQKTFNTAVDYNNFVVDMQDSIGYSVSAFHEIAVSETLTNAEKYTNGMSYLENCKKLTKSSLALLQKTKAFAKGDALKSAALNRINFYYRTMDVDYKRMIELLGVETYTEETLKQMTELEGKVTREEKVYEEAYIAAELAFAKLYGFDVSED